MSISESNSGVHTVIIRLLCLILPYCEKKSFRLVIVEYIIHNVLDSYFLLLVQKRLSFCHGKQFVNVLYRLISLIKLCFYFVYRNVIIRILFWHTSLSIVLWVSMSIVSVSIVQQRQKNDNKKSFKFNRSLRYYLYVVQQWIILFFVFRNIALASLIWLNFVIFFG